MKFADDQFNEAFLASVGEQAARMLQEQDYDALAENFDYALARGCPVAEAIRQDVAESLCAAGGELRLDASPRASITWLKPNDSGLLAVVECALPVVGDSGSILIELVVTATAESKHVTLEQVSHQPAGGVTLRFTRDGVEIRSKPWWKLW